MGRAGNSESLGQGSKARRCSRDRGQHMEPRVVGSQGKEAIEDGRTTGGGLR